VQGEERARIFGGEGNELRPGKVADGESLRYRGEMRRD